MELIGKVALITGGSKGIGKAAATELTKAGVHTIIVARGEEELKNAVNEIKSLTEIEKYGLRPSYRVADITNLSVIPELIDSITREYGGIDILINNAGVYRLDRLENIPSDLLKTTGDLNLTATGL